jgi:hypothetical protein
MPLLRPKVSRSLRLPPVYQGQTVLISCWINRRSGATGAAPSLSSLRQVGAIAAYLGVWYPAASRAAISGTT